MSQQAPKPSEPATGEDSPRSLQYQAMTEARLKRSLIRYRNTIWLSLFVGVGSMVLWLVLVFTDLVPSAFLRDYNGAFLLLGIVSLLNANFYRRKLRKTRTSMERWKDNLPRR